ncbi:MAG TPA: glycine--tRNA ligase subunit beta [Rhizomicrobium sp.]
MADLLLELFSEEIPARMQAQAAKDLERLVVGALSDRGLLFEGAKAFAGPRRLTLAVAGLPAKQPDVSEEKKGPRINAPAKAIDGFLRSAGVTLEQCEKRDDGKGEFYVAVIARKGRATADVLSEILPECFAKLPWPKSMRWPQETNAPVRWVRPLHSILCTLDGEIVPFHFAGIGSSDHTRGHRFLSSGPIVARRFDDYVKKLRAAHVILDAEERKAIIFEGVKSAAFIHGLELIADEGLLDEVAGLAEWPVVLVGSIKNQFMDVPPEILQTAMRVHQKYFALRDARSGKMANRFAFVANMVAEDGGKQIVAGNERVLRARLADAKFFWDQDRKTRLENRVAALGSIVFHAKLGTQLERVKRIEMLAAEIARIIGADVAKSCRAARLAKADLTTGVVGEFPELQGVLGRYYALNDNEDSEVADAIRDHYRPAGPNDSLPDGKVSLVVALADKLDVLTSLFSADERPTGSRDPFALRRAALGIVRIVLSNGLRIPIGAVAFGCLNRLQDQLRDREMSRLLKEPDAVIKAEVKAQDTLRGSRVDKASREFGLRAHEIAREVAAFVVDRLRVQLRDEGKRHDLVEAILEVQKASEVPEFRSAIVSRNTSWDDVLMVVNRVEALQAFLKSDDGANLLAGYKRAANILKAEEKKDGQGYFGEVEESHLAEPAEKALFAALTASKVAIAPALEKEDFAGAMRTMAGLRAPVDAFFDKVKVNADDKVVRANRLNLLGALRATLHQVADFSKIEG